MYNVMNF